jgi:hypothetical protein
MNRRQILGICTTVFAASSLRGAFAQRTNSWDGVWTGLWGGVSRTSITIVNGRLVRVDYEGQPSPVTIATIQRDSLTFGVPNNYIVRVERTGPNTATATFENFRTNETDAADLTRR